MKQGDLVVRQSYGGDVIFRIQAFKQHSALLRGLDYRLLADAPYTDLVPVAPAGLAQHEQEMRKKTDEAVLRLSREYRPQGEQQRGNGKQNRSSGYPYFEVPGKVLHLDGDPNYLRKSMTLYGELRVPAEGIYVPEARMSEALIRLLPQVRPDIVVITGHDGILKTRRDTDIHNLSSYKNSLHFVNAVRTARQYERNRDSLIIVAGACQSHFEALLQAGANYASSPARVLIHALDPLYLAAKVSYTPIKDTVQITDVIQHTMSGLEGLGGIETRGSYRVGVPKIKSSS